MCLPKWPFMFAGYTSEWPMFCRNVDSFPFRQEFWHYAFFLVLFLGKVMPNFCMTLMHACIFIINLFIITVQSWRWSVERWWTGGCGRWCRTWKKITGQRFYVRPLRHRHVRPLLRRHYRSSLRLVQCRHCLPVGVLNIVILIFNYPPSIAIHKPVMSRYAITRPSS